MTTPCLHHASKSQPPAPTIIPACLPACCRQAAGRRRQAPLLPVRHNHRIQRLLIIRRQRSLTRHRRRKRRHRRHQIIHLILQQRLAITQIKTTHPVSRATVPVLHSELVARLVQGQAQIVADPFQPVIAPATVQRVIAMLLSRSDRAPSVAAFTVSRMTHFRTP